MQTGKSAISSGVMRKVKAGVMSKLGMTHTNDPVDTEASAESDALLENNQTEHWDMAAWLNWY